MPTPADDPIRAISADLDLAKQLYGHVRELRVELSAAEADDRPEDMRRLRHQHRSAIDAWNAVAERLSARPPVYDAGDDA